MFKRIIILGILGLFVFNTSICVYAEYKRVKAVGEVETKRKKPNMEEKKWAYAVAKKKALDKYIAGLDSQRVRILNDLKDELYNNIDIYIPEIFPLNDGDWKDGHWKIDVEASINEAQIEELINKHTKNITKKEDVYLSFVFVAREVGGVVSFKDKETQRIVEGESYKEHEGQTEEGASVGERKNVYEKVTGGSAERKSEDVKYRGYNPEEIEAKVTEIFNKAEFQVVPSFEIGINRDNFAKDFAEKNDISDSTKKKTVDTAKENGVQFLAVGMLDIGREQIDQATGMSKVYVNVIGYVLDLRGKFTKKVASVGPIQYSGMGENPTVAKRNALINAGTSAAKDLVDQMRVKESL